MQSFTQRSPAAVQPGHSVGHLQHAGLRPVSRQLLPPARCLQCATRQLQQLFTVPGFNQIQQGASQQRSDCLQMRQQGIESQLQRSVLSALSAPSSEQHQSQWQLAFASSSSRCSSGSLEHSSISSNTAASVQDKQQLQPACSFSMSADADHAGYTGNSSSGSSSKNSSGGSNAAVVPGLPPLSSLVGEHDRSSSPFSEDTSEQEQKLQQQDQQQQMGATAAAISSRNGSGCNSSKHLVPETGSIAQEETAAEQETKEDSPGVQAALAMLRWYKSVLSPMMQSTCRFLPTCSQYSMDSYRSYGVAKGSVLTAWRLLRCNPWGPSGYDPTQWPPPGLGWLFQYQYSAEVAVVVGTAAFVKFAHVLLFE